MAKMPKASSGGVAAPATRYSRTTAKAICEMLAQGKPWAEICQGEGMPVLSTIHAWLGRHSDFARDVASARAVAAELWADEALQVARETTAGSASADRLRVSTLLGRAAVDSPQRWGGKVAPAERDEPAEVSFRFRRYEKVTGTDGRVVLREVFPQGDGQEP